MTDSNSLDIQAFIDCQRFGHDQPTPRERRHRLHKVFADFCEMSAIAISNSMDLTQREKREARYLEIVREYERAEVERFAQLLGVLAEWMAALPIASGNFSCRASGGSLGRPVAHALRGVQPHGARVTALRAQPRCRMPIRGESGPSRSGRSRISNSQGAPKVRSPSPARALVMRASARGFFRCWR